MQMRWEKIPIINLLCTPLISLLLHYISVYFLFKKKCLHLCLSCVLSLLLKFGRVGLSVNINCGVISWLMMINRIWYFISFSSKSDLMYVGYLIYNSKNFVLIVLVNIGWSELKFCLGRFICWNFDKLEEKIALLRILSVLHNTYRNREKKANKKNRKIKNKKQTNLILIKRKWMIGSPISTFISIGFHFNKEKEGFCASIDILDKSYP